eukprot:TRINITY_DN3431_c0_g1_i1.p1 TRINITY_DN3431_c0_g1~~TRINITY_DN3431_c0_g1_i1.p1  ORF type:complete len:110 (+),score=31.87 TRINITY_DN3431_c0_g1_i1:73-402(+)
MALDLYNGTTINRPLVGRSNKCIVRLFPSTRFTGNAMLHRVCEIIGLPAVYISTTGNRNPFDMIRAFFNALAQDMPYRDQALARGTPIKNFSGGVPEAMFGFRRPRNSY